MPKLGARSWRICDADRMRRYAPGRNAAAARLYRPGEPAPRLEQSIFANPYRLPPKHTREQRYAVIDRYALYLSESPHLLPACSAECWAAGATLERCHGDVLAGAANGSAAGSRHHCNVQCAIAFDIISTHTNARPPPTGPAVSMVLLPGDPILVASQDWW